MYWIFGIGLAVLFFLYMVFRPRGPVYALEYCRGHQKKTSWPMLTDEDFKWITNSNLFRNVERKYKAEGLSYWGGLAWFLSQTIEGSIKIWDEKGGVKDATMDMTTKLVSTVAVLENILPSLKAAITEKDMVVLERVFRASAVWLEVTRSPADREVEEMLGIQ